MIKNMLVVVAMLVGAGLSTPALAATQVNSPFGSAPVFGVIGSIRVGSLNKYTTQAILWARVSDGACSITYMGYSSLDADYEVHGSTGDDYLSILKSRETFCGYQVDPLSYGGHYLDLFGNSGNDRLKAGGGDTWLFGEQGNDRLYSENPFGAELGGAGDDSIIYAGPSGSAALYGEDGADCLAASNATASTMDCGAGADKWLIFTQPASGAVSCETPVYSCPLP